ncbi:MAG: FHA domain-containing protein, partial [Candidatus Acidiferrum sp.]
MSYNHCQEEWFTAHRRARRWWLVRGKHAMKPYRLNGELVPIGGGDNIPLQRHVLTLGRRESCDICLRFPNISGLHCEMTFREGYWYVRDLGSRNGVKINGERIREKVLRPTDRIGIGKRTFTIKYEMPKNQNLLDEEEGIEDVMSQSLLEKAGLERPRDYKGRTKPTF